MPPPAISRARPLLPALAAILTALLVLMLSAAPARAQQDALVPQSVVPPSPTEPPPGFAIAPNEARAAAEGVDAVRAARREHPGLRATVAVPTAGGDAGTYQVGYFTPLERSQYGSDIRVEVVVSGLTGEVLEVWTGPQAATPLARGGEPSLGRSLNKPWVWLPLAALFLLPFVDPRRPLRLVHLDLLVLLAFGLSQLYFNQGRLEISVPLVYPLLAYLLVRALLAGFRPRPRLREALVPWLPMRWLAVGLVLLVAFRVGLNVQDSTGATRVRSAPTESRTARSSTCRTRCTATPTGRSPTSPTYRSRRCCPGTEAGAPYRPPTPRRSRSTCSRSSA
jgi:hypothetical protein